MQTGGYHRGQVFVHWVVANAAGGGAVAAMLELIDLGISQLILPNAGGGLLAMVIGFLLLLVVLYAQELILRAGGLPSPSWVVASIGGIFFGGVAAIFMAIMLGAAGIFSGSIVLILLAEIVSVFTGGATLGLVQSTLYRRSWIAHLAWIGANGGVLFPMLFLTFLIDGLIPVGGPTHGTLLGGLYGIVTATCLVWLLPRTQEAAEANQRAALIAGRDGEEMSDR